MSYIAQEAHLHRPVPEAASRKASLQQPGCMAHKHQNLMHGHAVTIPHVATHTHTNQAEIAAIVIIRAQQ